MSRDGSAPSTASRLGAERAGAGSIPAGALTRAVVEPQMMGSADLDALRDVIPRAKAYDRALRAGRRTRPPRSPGAQELLDSGGEAVDLRLAEREGERDEAAATVGEAPLEHVQMKEGA